MNRKVSIVFTILLTIMMSVTIVVYGRKGEDKSKENVFAVKYNTAFDLVRNVENFDQEKGTAGIEGLIIATNNAISDLETFVNENDVIEKEAIQKTTSVWRDRIIVESDEIYEKATMTMEEVVALDINDKEQREEMQDKINLGVQYINTLTSLESTKGEGKNVALSNLKNKYQDYQNSIEKLLFNTLDTAINDLNQENIDILMDTIPQGFPSDLKGWYVDTANDLQEQLKNQVVKEVSLLYSEKIQNMDRALIENHKKKIQEMLTQFLNSSNEDIRGWAQDISGLIDSNE